MSRQFFFIWSLFMGATIAWILWPEGHQGNGEALASLKSSSGKVEVRRAGTFAWAPSRKDARFFAFDSIATGDASTAILVLNDGTEIQLPEDTQLKIQQQALDQGLEISVLRGGVAVHKAPTTKRKKSQEKKSLLSIASQSYKIDLSNLKGAFSLGANALIKATSPDDITINSKTEATSLATLQAADSEVKLNKNAPNSLVDGISLPTIKVDSPPPPPPSPKPKPPPPSPAPKIALVEEPKDNLVHVEWRTSKSSYWSEGTLADSSNELIVLANTWTMENQERWDTPVRIENLQNKKTLILRRPYKAEGWAFSLADLRPLVDLSSLNEMQITLETGLVKKTEGLEKTVWSAKKATVSLQSLRVRKAVTLILDNWTNQAGKGWIPARPSPTTKIVIHLLDPALLPKLAPIIRGAQGFRIEPARNVQLQAYGIIKGPNLVAAMDQLQDPLLKQVAKDIEADLIFKGSIAAYLGGRGQFDLLEYLTKSTDVFYIRRGLSLKLDAALFKTQSAARDFMQRFNPYFFREAVEVKYSGTP